MNRTICTALVGMLALAVVGCSSTTDGNLRPGDPNDPTFQQSKAQWEAAISQAVGSIDLTMDYAFISPSDTVAPVRQGRGHVSADAAVDTFSYSWDPVNGWHVAYAVFSDSGLFATVLDSVQFRDATSQFQQDFDSLSTDYIRVKQLLDLSMDDTLLFQADLASLFDMTLSGLTGSVVMANGNANMGMDMSFSDSASSCDISFAFAQNLQSVAFSQPASENDGVCPLSGSMQLTGTVSVACTSAQGSETYNETWEVNVTFNNNGTMEVEAQSGNTVWTYTGDTPCGNYESMF